MRFESPWYLFLMLLVPLWWWIAAKRNKTQYIQFSSIEGLKLFSKNSWWSHPYFIPTLRGIVLILLILTVSRPQTGRSYTEVQSEGVDIILAIDTSGSMRALDLKLEGKNVTRLEVVKDTLEDFIKNRLNDRIGMVVFGEEAFTQAPLTRDHELLVSFLNQTFIGMAGDATAIGSAIVIGTKRLKDLKAPSKILVLLTDGENTAGHVKPIQAAEAAKELGIKIYTVGVGTKGRAPIEVDGFLGKQIRFMTVSIDEESLTKIAEKTGGQYFRATDTESLKNIYKTIDSLEKSEVKVKEYHEYTEHFSLFLVPALLLFLLEFILVRTRLRRLP